MESVIYFAISSLYEYIAQAVGLFTGLIMLIYFTISMFQFIRDSLDDPRGMRK